MMGRQTTPERLFYDFCLEDHVPAGHLLRQIDGMLDLDELRHQQKPFYSPIGRPSWTRRNWSCRGLKCARSQYTHRCDPWAPPLRKF
jgi:hypothetical protein